MERRLAMTVFVENERYDAGSVPPAEVAEKITSPYAWQSTEDDKAEDGDKPAAAATSSDSEDTDAKTRKATRRA